MTSTFLFAFILMTVLVSLMAIGVISVSYTHLTLPTKRIV